MVTPLLFAAHEITSQKLQLFRPFFHLITNDNKRYGIIIIIKYAIYANILLFLHHLLLLYDIIVIIINY